MGKGTVVVTGANGFVASWIVKQLLERGYNVRGTVRDPKDEHKVGHLLKMPGAKGRLVLFKAELLAQGSFDEVVDGADYVIHSATPVVMDGADDPQKEVIDPSVEGTLGVLKSVSKSKTVKKVVSTSSTSAVFYSDRFLNKSEEEVVDESWWTDPEYCRKREMWYHVGKTLGERAGYEYAQDKHFDFVSILPCTVLGALLHKGNNWCSNEITRILAGKPREQEKHMDIEANVGFVHVEDLARAHILAMEDPNAQGRYLAIGRSMNLDQLSLLVSQLYPDHPVQKPDLKGVDGETFMKPHFKFSTEKLQKLGLNFTPIEEAVKKTVESLELRKQQAI